MSTSRSPDVGRWRGRGGAWRAVALLALLALAYATWRVIGYTPYRIDIDVYRMGAQAWRDGHHLYGTALFRTGVKETSLPFTYPPMAAVLFTPFTWVSLGGAAAALTVISTVLLVVSTAIVLSALGVCTDAAVPGGPVWWRRTVLATVIVAAAIWLNMEPIMSNFGYGQINAVLMTLVIADCLPQRTRWPRGMLLGLAIAVKLTPAVFLLYFLVRRDRRAALTTLATFAATILAAFVLAPRDSVEYWTKTVFHTNRIGDTALNTNQNFAGILARMGVSGGPYLLLWLAVCVATLVLTVWAVRRVLAAEQPTLALMAVALFGLLVSPVSWSHHWVWSLPTIVILGVLGYRRRSPALLGLAVAGLALMRWSPIRLLLADSNLTQQLIGASYVWWALAVLVTAGLAVTARVEEPGAAVDPAPARLAG
ncbi:glycosyltransferase 87 family protein [Mycobacterium sp. pUA109]|uniref:glycosyltransferase 87 family protein n=1 Tax=Mycobacterium sp. pUA109 TaxID=3238982 RepID=UPI00351B29B7